jgi:hypothetical protein
MPDKPVAVVIPFYRDTLSESEAISIKQCFKVLSKHPIICIKPSSLSLVKAEEHFSFSHTVTFDDDFFDGIQGYNRLMLSSRFYKAFLEYEFILLYQLDAFVFRDDLLYWCNQGFDYIGAPWIRDREYSDIVKMLKSKFQTFYHTKYNVYKEGLPSNMQFENKVGNGGFSLRRVKKLYGLSIKYVERIEFYHMQADHRFHEDVFWSIEVNRKRPELKIPNYRKALNFAFENHPERCLRLNKNKLPFGCHAWDKYLSFWEKYMH